MAKIKGVTPQDKRINTLVYNEYNQLDMVDGWHRGEKLAKYEQMAQIIDLTGIPFKDTACLDVGCGTGDLSSFLRRKGVAYYLGIDVYKPAIEEARRKYPKEQFLLGDFLTTDIKQQFAYAFCSGALTVKLPKTDNYDFLESAISKMWHLTTVGAVFNILTDDDTDPDPDLFFYNADRVLSLCYKVAKSAIIHTEKTPHAAELHVFLYR